MFETDLIAINGAGQDGGSGTDSASVKHPARRWLGVFLAAPLFALMMLCDHFGIYQYFWAALLSVTALVFAIWENRSYHREIWFWVCLLVFSLFHVLLVEVVAEHKWFNEVHGYQAKGLLGFALVDAAIMTGVIRFPDWITRSLEWIFMDDSGKAAK